MNRIILLLLIFTVVAFFFLGLFLGTYNLFPFSAVDYMKNQLEPNPSQFNDIKFEIENFDDKISLQNIDDVKIKRKQLVQFIWKTSELPNQLPGLVDKNISDDRFNTLSNLKQIDRLKIEMDYGLSSIVYVFLPENDNGSMILYHQGHSGGFVNGKSTIQEFLNDGFSVAAFSMPLLGLNNQPIIELENIGQIKFFKHNQFILLETDKFSSMSYFFTPITVTLNYLHDNYSFNNFHMVGISGGGWTTTVYSALDPRITKSFSIAGSLPLSLRTIVDDVGDYEQFNPEFYSLANYFDIYIMSSSGQGREHIQIFNKFDPCCFSGSISSYSYDALQQSIIPFDSGHFEIIVDDTHNEHKISNSIINLITRYLT